MLTPQEVLAEARYAMVTGSLCRAPVPARIVEQWLDVLEEALQLTPAHPRVDVWCDGWYKEYAPLELRMGYSFRAVIGGTVLTAIRGRIPKNKYRQPVNVAEYLALIYALQWVKEHRFRGNVFVHTDSQTTWGQVTQAWNTNAHKFPHIGRLWAEASQLLDEVDGRLVKEPRSMVRAMLGH